MNNLFAVLYAIGVIVFHIGYVYFKNSSNSDEIGLTIAGALYLASFWCLVNLTLLAIK